MMKRELILDGHIINDENDCYVVAEIGHNHQGSIDKTKDLIREAKKCGADAVKLQKRDVRSLYTCEMYDMPYANENSFGLTYGAHREALELSWDAYLEIIGFSEEIEITLFATAFDFASADFLEELNMPAFKIASGDLKNTPLQKHVAKFGKPLILSTGGGSLDDVARAYDSIMPINQNLCILQCTASYPTEAEELNLQVISTFRQRFPDIVVGLSDHQNGISMAPVAYVLGARVIEKHFTLNHTWKGTDHPFSLEPIGLQKMVRDLRRTRLALGNGIKEPYSSEAAPLRKMSKKLVAACDLPAETILTLDQICIKSPGGGLPPCDINKVLGRKTRRSLKQDENISLEDLVETFPALSSAISIGQSTLEE